ncbi:MAG: hypothetical protein GY789_03815 [Hyphomicrobiales bacterium]|nr:hypothetical protein [Hyphomicrobiales bacterium]MCP4997271.1 hypothetical protein [Hyphomicrobiales bacterium]
MYAFQKAALSSMFVVLCVLSAPEALAQSSDPAWLDDLGMQLRSEKACEPNLYINMREGEIGTSKYYEARVQCLDGRMFDATRTEPDKEFTIRACGVAVC